MIRAGERVEINVIPGVGCDDTDNVQVWAAALNRRRKGREIGSQLAFIADRNAHESTVGLQRDGGRPTGLALVSVRLQDGAFGFAILAGPGPVPHFVSAA